MLNELIQNKHLILGSGSPRRSFFLKELGLVFDISIKEVEESYPPHLMGKEISEYLSKLKAEPFLSELTDNDILITADTIVWFRGKALGKPTSKNEARKMLRTLSNSAHEVISSVALTTIHKQVVFSDTTKVIFKELSDKEINYYIDAYKPFDKAGAYGIQEWLGYIGIERIEGNYFNVMGFPVQLFYEALQQI